MHSVATHTNDFDNVIYRIANETDVSAHKAKAPKTEPSECWSSRLLVGSTCLDRQKMLTRNFFRVARLLECI